MFFFFFFQAEDGIRDGRVTGVQTCALPILTLLDNSTEFLIIRVQDSLYGQAGTVSRCTIVYNCRISYRNSCVCRSDFTDRKSTRLNSSHPSISYAVFCLQKKNTVLLLAQLL